MATGKNEKEYSWHVPAIKFIGMKQLVSKVANILEKLQNLWKWEIWGNIMKIWYFVSNFLTLIYPAHFEDVPCQSGVNHIFEG